VKTVFVRVLAAQDKARVLFDALRETGRPLGRQRFEVDATSFANVPRSPFAYWVSQGLRNLFKELPSFETSGRTATVGLQSSDDFRFLRLWFEPQSNNSYFSFAKGGTFSSVYADLVLSVDWEDTGHEIKAFAETTPGSKHWSRNIRSAEHYFRRGLTWPSRTNGLSLRVLPEGCVFGHKGPAAFVESDSINDLLSLASLTNSSAFGLLVSLQLARTELAQSYEVGLIQTTPVPRLTDSERETLAGLARRAWSLKRSLDIRTETSHAFTLPALLQVAGGSFDIRGAACAEHIRDIDTDLAAIQAEIDERCFALYGIEEADRRAIIEGFGPRDLTEQPSDCFGDAEDDAGEETEANESTIDSTALAAELVSWAVGVAFGRFDVRLGTGARPLPTEPEPFDPLPACSPGMLTGENGLPVAQPPGDYPLGFPEVGVLVDDPGHTQDLASAVRTGFGAVFGADADRWWSDVASLLDPRDSGLRAWLAGSFFEHHIKRYSKSRRKAPIYWQVATPSASYSVWLYAHRLTRDSLFKIQKEIVEPKLLHEECEVTRLVQEAGPTPTSQQRKEIAAQETFVAELRAFRDEIARVAPLWNPNLDDGVVIVSAPLWRLFPQHKAWQKELKGYWDELCAGKYDWSHLAMHLWPERVVPVCATDRSIAIAHDLEDVFWTEEANGKWKPRAQPTRPIAELIAERTSPAVMAALKSLIDAPVATGAGTRRKPRRP
jgi:hypothetical protein